jgi:predicted dehydrogenase/NAD(P)-dependent dehydrogenase (short-subunit alcohol dehydrogenase family)
MEHTTDTMAEAQRAAGSGTIRVGLIGCGKMGLQHVKAIRGIPNAVIVGVADAAADPGELAASLPPGVEVVPDAASLLTRLKPDVVHIVTPPSTHVDLAVRALEAGCHVYVEKPFALTVADAEAIFAAAAAHGRQACAGHQCLFDVPARQVHDVAPQIGRIVHVESFFSFRTARRGISPVDQAKDILPHAVYPLVDQLGLGAAADAPIEVVGADVRANGDVYALVRRGDASGIVLVTLNGRPIEQYQRIVGTNGALRADYITGALVRLIGPGTGPGVLLTPFRFARQTAKGARRGILALLTGKRSSYPGLQALIAAFYDSIRTNQPPPLTRQSILDTVHVCERLGDLMDQRAREAESVAGASFHAAEAALPPRTGRRVFVTGGTGLLGSRVADELIAAGHAVRVLARRVPGSAARIPGVEYVVGDLARPLPEGALRGIDIVVHCAAETAGGKADHQRNSIDATRRIFEAAAAAGVKEIVHISSIAVLKPGKEVGYPIDESTPIDTGRLDRGPYVWGKAESEVLAGELGRSLGLTVKIVRPGPLVDFAAFQPPGRLGRELGPWFVAIGPRRKALSICDVGTAAKVLRSYVEDLAAAPPVLNLVDVPSPTRAELMARFTRDRPDLRVVWFPAIVLRTLSPILKIVQRLLTKGTPIDVYAAFAAERYRTDLAAAVIARASQPKPAAVTPVGSAR